MQYSIKKKPNGIYFVSYYEGETRRRISTQTTDLKEARARARGIVGGTFAPVVSSKPTRAGAMTVGELLDRCHQTVWRTARSQATLKSNIKILQEMCGQWVVAELTYARLEELVRSLFDRGYAAGTVHRKLCTLSKALNQATKMTYADGRPVLQGKVPMPTVTAKNSRDRIISPEEEVAIFNAVDARARSETTRDWRRFGHLLRFLLDSGCRLSEALNVREANLEERNGRIFVLFPRYTTKSDKPRSLPLSNDITGRLPHLRANAVDGRLFPLKPQTAWYMWNTIRGDVAKAGLCIDDVVLHTFRHTCLTRLAKSGKVRLEHISDWAGHANMEITRQFYLHLMPEDKLSTLAALEAVTSGIRERVPT